MSTAAIVKRLPKAGDVAGIFADQQRREFLVDHRGQPLVCRQAADLRLIPHSVSMRTNVASKEVVRPKSLVCCFSGGIGM